MEERPPKRARIPLACISCRQHKTRCDGGRPLCGCCQRRDPQCQTPCVYQNQAKARESKEIQSLLERIDQLQGSRNSSLPVGGSEIHGSPLFGGQQSVQARVTANGPLLDQFPARNPSGSREAAVDIEDPLPDISERSRTSQNRRSSSVTDARTGQIEAASLRGQNTNGFSHLDVSNRQERFTDGAVLKTPAASFEESSRTRQRKGDNDTSSRREDILQASQVNAVNVHLQEAGGERSQEDDEPYFYGESSSTALMQEAQDIISPSVNLEFSSNADTLQGESSIYLPPSYHQRREDNIKALPSMFLMAENHLNDLDLPPRPLADHLLLCYFDRVHILYPFLHKPTFEAAYEKLWVPSTVGENHESSGTSNRLVDVGLGNFTNSGPDSRIFRGGVNAIFALGCQFSDLPISKSLAAAKGYLERAMALLLHPELLDDPTISVVQVLLLLCLHLQSTPLRNRLWNTIGLALRMAQGLALHDDDGRRHGNKQTKGNIWIEIRRRIWYSCTMLEMTISMTLGVTSAVSNEYAVPFPLALEDDELGSLESSSSSNVAHSQTEICLTSFFVEAIKLSELTGKMLRSLNPGSATRRKAVTTIQNNGDRDSLGSFDIIMDLERTWISLYDNLPPALRWQKSVASVLAPPSTLNTDRMSASTRLERQRNVLHTRFLYFKVLLYRSLFLQICRERITQQGMRPQTITRQQQTSRKDSSPQSNDDFTTIRSYFAIRCSTECFRAAEELMRVVHTIHRSDAAGAWWYTLFYAYSSGIVVILTRFCPPLVDILGTDCIEKSWVFCQEILEHMTIYGNHAQRCLARLQDLRSRLESSEFGQANDLQQKSKSNSDCEKIVQAQSVSKNLPQESSTRYEREDRTAATFDSENRDKEMQSGMSISCDPFDMGDIPAGLDHPQSVFGISSGNNLPWEVDFDDWWTFDMTSTDYEPPPAATPQRR